MTDTKKTALQVNMRESIDALEALAQVGKHQHADPNFLNDLEAFLGELGDLETRIAALEANR